MSDNATCFNSSEFDEFCKFNGIFHLNFPQYHPQSNGLAESGVGIVKSNLRMCFSERKTDVETHTAVRPCVTSVSIDKLFL